MLGKKLNELAQYKLEPYEALTLQFMLVVQDAMLENMELRDLENLSVSDLVKWIKKSRRSQ